MIGGGLHLLRCCSSRTASSRTSSSTTPTRTSGWSKDKLIFGPGGILKPESAGGWNPITLQYEAVRDTIVVLLHALFFGLQHLARDLVAEAWRQGQGHQGTPDVDLRPPPGEEGMTGTQ